MHFHRLLIDKNLGARSDKSKQGKGKKKRREEGGGGGRERERFGDAGRRRDARLGWSARSRPASFKSAPSSFLKAIRRHSGFSRKKKKKRKREKKKRGKEEQESRGGRA